jgi:hypothetical protein
MSVNATAPYAQEPARNEDRAIAYVQWRLACIAVRTAYQESANAAKADGSLAHAPYQAVARRGDAAAGAYARL